MRYVVGFLVRPTRDELDVGLAVVLRTLGLAALRCCSSHDLRTEHKTISKGRINDGNILCRQQYYLYSKLTRNDSVSLFSTNDV